VAPHHKYQTFDSDIPNPHGSELNKMFNLHAVIMLGGPIPDMKEIGLSL
jgi:hypothetical protein